MGYYLGQFYFEKRDLYLVLAIVLLLLGNYFAFPLPFFNYQKLIFLTLLFLLTKGFLPPTLDAILLILFMTSAFLSLFHPLFQVLIFVILALFFLKILKAI
jgi:hypothetical protein